MASRVGVDLTALVLRDVQQCDLSAGNHSAGRVEDSPLDAAALRKLRPGAGRHEEKD
jgi:hypothetical protein